MRLLSNLVRLCCLIAIIVTLGLSGLPSALAQSKKPSVVTPQFAGVTSPSVVISQVYGGAGCGTAGCSTYQNDFIQSQHRTGNTDRLFCAVRCRHGHGLAGHCITGDPHASARPVLFDRRVFWR